VKLSVKSDYATRAVLGLALHYESGKALHVETLANQQNIPPNYLVQILIELKSKKIVRSLRGKEGGYFLAKPPSEITIGDVVRCIHGQVFDPPGLGDSTCPRELKEIWKKLQAALDRTANEINFEDIVERHSNRDEMYYI